MAFIYTINSKISLAIIESEAVANDTSVGPSWAEDFTTEGCAAVFAIAKDSLGLVPIRGDTKAWLPKLQASGSLAHLSAHARGLANEHAKRQKRVGDKARAWLSDQRAEQHPNPYTEQFNELVASVKPATHTTS